MRFRFAIQRSFPVLLLCLNACQPSVQQQEAAALTLSPDDLGKRQREMRRFDTTDDVMLMRASASVLQDLGFSIDDAAAKAGLIVASKDRDAVEAQQVAGQVLLAVLVAAAGGAPNPIWDKNQKIRVSVVTRLTQNRKAIIVQATFQRVIWNTKGQISRFESIDSPTIYQEFFEKLSKAVFLTANDI